MILLTLDFPIWPYLANFDLFWPYIAKFGLLRSNLNPIMVQNNKISCFKAQRAQGETETTIEAEGHEEGS